MSVSKLLNIISLARGWWIKNTQLHPLSKTYRTFKHDYAMEPYMYLVKKYKYRQAIAKFHRRSHRLEIKRGLHAHPKGLVADRKCVCVVCVTEDEKRSSLNCYITVTDREYFFHKISQINDLWVWTTRRNFQIYWQIKIYSAWLGLVNLSLVLLRREMHMRPPINHVDCIFTSIQICQYTYMHIYTYIKIDLEVYHMPE